MIRKLLFAIALAVAASAQQVGQDDRAAMRQELEELKRRIALLEQRLNEPATTQTATAVAATVPPVGARSGSYVDANTSGFTINSGDGNFSLKVGADLQVDNHNFVSAADATAVDGLLARRVRPTFSGSVYKYVDYFFRPDFGLGNTVIYDAYMQLNYIPHMNLRVGKFKPPVGLERLQSDDDTNFIERGLPTLLVPSRDIGYQLTGDLLKGRVTVQAGVFNGVPDNSLSDSSPGNHRDYAGRFFLTPFAVSEKSPLKGLGFGIGASGGGADGVGLPSFKTAGLNAFFPFAAGVAEAGHRTRLAPQGYYNLGPLGILAEYGVNEEELQKALARHEVAFRAWQVQAAYVLTGEGKGFSGVAPRHPFDPMHGAWGALEVAARTGGFRADQGIFAYGFAAPTAAPRQLREYVGGLNWYLNRLVRISADYAYTGFQGGAVSGDRIAERVVLLRFQINFI